MEENPSATPSSSGGGRTCNRAYGMRDEKIIYETAGARFKV
jgi:hypothetical protein